MFAGTDILKAATISGAMVMGLAPVFLFYGFTGFSPWSCHLSFWTGLGLGVLLAVVRFTPTLHRFSELEAWRVVFPRAARSVATRSVASLYVRTGNASTDRGKAAIPGSVAVPARKFMQRWGLFSIRPPRDAVRGRRWGILQPSAPETYSPVR